MAWQSVRGPRARPLERGDSAPPTMADVAFSKAAPSFALASGREIHGDTGHLSTANRIGGLLYCQIVMLRRLGCQLRPWRSASPIQAAVRTSLENLRSPLSSGFSTPAARFPLKRDPRHSGCSRVDLLRRSRPQPPAVCGVRTVGIPQVAVQGGEIVLPTAKHSAGCLAERGWRQHPRR